MKDIKPIQEWCKENIGHLPPILKTKSCMFIMYGYRHQLINCEPPHRIYQCIDYIGTEYDQEITLFIDDKTKTIISYPNLEEYKKQIGWKHVSKYTFPHPNLEDTLGDNLRYYPEKVTQKDIYAPWKIVIPRREKLQSIKRGNVSELSYIRYEGPKTARIFNRNHRHNPRRR